MSGQTGRGPFLAGARAAETILSAPPPVGAAAPLAGPSAANNAPPPAGHPFAPVYDARSRVLILGSWPSPKSREQGFFYGHPQNRFWPMLAAVTGEPTPAPADLEAKKALLLRHRIALWDVLASCTITGASDASIKDAVPTDLAPILAAAPIGAVLCNGAAAYRLYEKYQRPRTGIPAVRLPSTSPANAAVRPAALAEAWGRALRPWLDADC